MRISDWSSDVCSSDLDKVAADLSSYGFAVTDITRINRQEFDVVTVLGDVIHNFQCKNNWIDLGKLESDRRLLARYNRRLDRYYRNADRKSTRLNSSHSCAARMPSAACNKKLQHILTGITITTIPLLPLS